MKNQKDMKTLIANALNLAIVKLDRFTPTTKKEIKTISIDDVMPVDIPHFMKKNSIPDNADFNGVDNGYDGWCPGEIGLSWEIDVPTTDSDKLKFKRKRFTGVAWKFIYETLTKNEYKRKGFNTGLLKEFDNTTIYDMYQNKELDRLIKYYLLSFTGYIK